jgi:hypothetical protein
MCLPSTHKATIAVNLRVMLQCRQFSSPYSQGNYMQSWKRLGCLTQQISSCDQFAHSKSPGLFWLQNLAFLPFLREPWEREVVDLKMHQ